MISRKRTTYHGRRGHDRHRHTVRPRGTWNRWGVALVIVVGLMIIAHHYGVTVHITR